MRILTWNIYGTSLRDRNERFPIVKKAIEEAQPDIACIQEAFFSKSRKMLENIKGYHISYFTNWYPLPGIVESTKGGLVTLTKEKPLEVSFHSYQAQGAWLTEQRWDRLLGKGFLETLIDDKEFGRVAVINTHKVCTYKKDMDGYLEAQAAQLLQNIKQQKENCKLIIATGDFNFKRKSKLYPRFKEILHDMTEKLPEAVENLRRFHFFDYETIDYIFASNHHLFEASYVPIEEGKYPSDHPGIMVNIRLKTPLFPQ